LELLKEIKKEKRIVDLGCGDGVILKVLFRTKILPKDSILISVDNSKIRCRAAKNNVPDATFIVGPPENTPLIDESGLFKSFYRISKLFYKN